MRQWKGVMVILPVKARVMRADLLATGSNGAYGTYDSK